MITEDPLVKDAPPPLYIESTGDADSVSGHAYIPARSNGKGYDPLPTYETADDDGDLEADGVGRQIKTFKFPYVGDDMEVHYARSKKDTKDVEALLKYVKKVSAEPHDLQAWSLEISVQKRSDSEKRLYTIRLPNPLAGTTLYALPDDAPCLRGGSTGFLDSVWSKYGHNDKAAVVDDLLRPTPAGLETILDARARWDAGVSPPWITERSSAPEIFSPTKAIRTVLGNVASSDVRCMSLVCPRIIHGWDCEALQSSISAALTQRRGLAAAFTGSQQLVTVTFKQPKPHVLTIADVPWLAAASQPVFILPIAFIGFFLTILLPCVRAWPGALVVAPITASICTLLVMYRGHQHVHDGVGFGFAMKRWSPTGLPASFSREEVVEELAQRDSLPSLPPMDHMVDTTPRPAAKAFHLRRTTRGWEVLQGCREGDWLTPDRLEQIVDLIEKKESGDITERVESAIRQKQARERRKMRRIEEEDDSLGL